MRRLHNIFGNKLWAAVTAVLAITVCSFSSRALTLSRFEEADRLPSTTVKAFYEDRDGYLWMGTTNGLTRWDGYRMISYASDSRNPSLLGSNDVTILAESDSGELYVGTTRGLFKMSADRRRVIPATSPYLNDGEIRALLTEKNGRIIVGTDKGAFATDSLMGDATMRMEDIPSGAVNTIVRDGKGDVWIGVWHGGLFKSNGNDRRFTKLPKVGEFDNPMRLLALDNGMMLASTWESGLYVAKRAIDGSWNVNAIPVDEEHSHVVRCVYGLVPDSEGRIWMLGHRSMAVGKFEGDNLKILDVPGIGGRINNVFSNVLSTRDNTIWVSTFSGGVWKIKLGNDGVEMIDLPVLGKYPSMANPFINRMYVTSDKTVWFNQNRWGLGIYTPSDGKGMLYSEIPSLKDYEELSTVGCLLPGKSADEVVAVSRYLPAVFRLRMRNGMPELLEKIELGDYPDSHRNLTGGCVTPAGYIWLSGQNSLELVSPSGKSHHLFAGVIDPIVMRSGKGEDVYVSTASKGLLKVQVERMDSVTMKMVMSRVGDTSGMSVRGFDINRATGDIWLVNHFGELWHVDARGKQDASPALTMDCSKLGTPVSVTIDSAGLIWIATHRSVLRYSPSTGSVVRYLDLPAPEGVEALVESSVYYDQSDSKIYFGGNGGIAAVNIGHAHAFHAGTPVVTDVAVDGVSLLRDDREGEFDSAGKRIVLSPDARNIRFSFSTLNLGNPEKVRCQFRLKGLDRDWQEADDFGSSAFFNRLPSGKYELEIRACGPDGLWTGSPVIYKVVKECWWYQSWWAWMLYSAIALGLVYLGYRIWHRQKTVHQQLETIETERRNTEDLAKLKLQYVANVSHEFLTPVSIIGCVADEMERGAKVKGEQISAIKENLVRIRRLVEEALDIRSLDRKEVGLHLQCGDLAAFVSRVSMNHFSAVMASKQIEFEVVTPDESVICWFDRDKIEKILFNLVGNAYKYTNSGGSVTVTLKYAGEEPESDMLEASLIVKDTGVGISEADRGHVFDRFYGDMNAGPHISHGLGLAIVKEFAMLHGGDVAVESELGKGSVFTVTLPVKREKGEKAVDVEDVDTLNEEAIYNVSDEEELSSRVKVLIVEDNVELMNVMCRVLGEQYQVMHACDGKEGLEMAEREHPDIVVSDVMMPEMDGLEMTRRLKHSISTSHIPVILLTAKTSPEDRVECYRAGADGYISKPFEIKVLEARIESIIANRRQERENVKHQPDIDPMEVASSTVDKDFLEKIMDVVKQNLGSTEIEMDDLADKMCMSRSSFYRKVKTLTGLSPMEFVKNIKLRHGYELLRTTDLSVAEVAYASGFSSSKYFSSCFKAEFGITPRQRRHEAAK